MELLRKCYSNVFLREYAYFALGQRERGEVISNVKGHFWHCTQKTTQIYKTIYHIYHLEHAQAYKTHLNFKRDVSGKNDYILPYKNLVPSAQSLSRGWLI